LLGKTTYEIYTKNGREKSGKKLENFLKELNDIGVGEIVINSIDRDGTMEGYDNTLVKLVRDAVDIPITILGGAGSHEDIKSLIKDYKIIGAAAGSLFVFKGKYRAVLINYPNRIEKRNILNNQ
ncbi:MAG TPA: HisA/HisF-related TIM barrel protein, partial [Saprospiraceae bacterium]|nr:HisA/HisF-related TIM barrel protein [Saprospiraceae bacterium]